jgi:hypothetical protein
MRHLAGTVTIFLTVLALQVTLVFPALATSLSVAPSAGPSGSIVEVQGSGFLPDVVVALCWDKAGCSNLGRIETDGNGELNTNVEVPADSTSGVHTLNACQIGLATCGQATFEVLGSVEESTTTEPEAVTTTTEMSTTTTLTSTTQVTTTSTTTPDSTTSTQAAPAFSPTTASSATTTTTEPLTTATTTADVSGAVPTTSGSKTSPPRGSPPDQTIGESTINQPTTTTAPEGADHESTEYRSLSNIRERYSPPGTEDASSSAGAIESSQTTETTFEDTDDQTPLASSSSTPKGILDDLNPIVAWLAVMIPTILIFLAIDEVRRRRN